MLPAMRRIRKIALAAVLLPASAAAEGIVSEIRLGMLHHDAGIMTVDKERGTDGNVEVLFASPSALDVIGAPRPHIGASVNSVGDTDQAYGGLTWAYDFTGTLFCEGSLGGAVHDGKLNKKDPGRKALGSRVLFRESVSLGWRFDAHHSLSLMIDHVSNANLASHNAGLDGVGLRYGYRF
jgi:lipid A 3-O-deacylase